MKKILHIISSPKGENSISIKLGDTIIDAQFIQTGRFNRLIFVSTDLKGLLGFWG